MTNLPLPPALLSFQDNVRLLVTAEIPAGRGDPERMAEMVAALSDALAMAIAAATRGEDQPMNKMLEGIEQHLFTLAASYAPIVNLVEEMHRQASENGRKT